MVACLVLSDLLLSDHDAGVDVVWQPASIPIDHHSGDLATSSSSWAPTLARPFTRWDAAHLLGVARDGYATETSLAFFPLYPHAVRALAAVAGADSPAGHVLAAVLISNACFVAAGAYRPPPPPLPSPLPPPLTTAA